MCKLSKSLKYFIFKVLSLNFILNLQWTKYFKGKGEGFFFWNEINSIFKGNCQCYLIIVPLLYIKFSFSHMFAGDLSIECH